LPLGTQLKVTNAKNDKSVVVTVNDRGPVPKDRMVDLSNAAAKELGMTKSGTAQVQTEVVGKDGGAAK
jgi:rare lipoprotein A